MMHVEVRLAADGGGLELAPPEGTVLDLQRELRNQEPGITARRRRGRLRVSFSDGRQLLEIAPPGMEWDADARRATENRARVHDRASVVLERVRRAITSGPEAARSQLRAGGLIDLLDDHQAVNVAVMTVPGGWGSCVFDEQGTGKTLTVIAAFDVLVERNEVDVLLVAAPKSMVAEWAAEFARFTGDMYTVAVAQGSRREKAEALNGGADVVVMNYETAVALRDDLRLLARRARVALVADESFNVKNPAAARTAALADLREWCTRCFVLCGTPAPNSPDDLIAQFDLVDFGYTFGELQHGDGHDDRREQLRAAMDARGVYTRNLKRQVIPDLPTRRFTEVVVELAPVQQRMYRAALNDLVADLESISDADFERHAASFVGRRTALLRVCSNPAPLAGTYDELPAKLAALDDLLPRYLEADEKIIIWSFYRASLDALAKRYSEFGLVRIDGGVSDVGARREAVHRFQNDPDVRLFVGNPAAAGAGLTLHSARLAVYESMSNQAAHFMQSLDRIHRRGQARDVEYLVLLCRGTIEENEYRRLLDKTDAQADVLGDPAAERPTRQLMLNELVESATGTSYR